MQMFRAGRQVGRFGIGNAEAPQPTTLSATPAANSCNHHAGCSNAIDRFTYGAVLDFALFHVQIGGNTYNWYVVNLADVAIVAGVAALLYDSFLGVPAAKAP